MKNLILRKQINQILNNNKINNKINFYKLNKISLLMRSQIMTIGILIRIYLFLIIKMKFLTVMKNFMMRRVIFHQIQISKKKNNVSKTIDF